MRANFKSQDYVTGVLIGLVLILYPFNPFATLPVLLFLFIAILISREVAITQSKTLIVLLGGHILWIFFSFYMNNANIGVVLKDIAAPIFLICIFLLRISHSLVKGVCVAVAVLFFIDFAFNVSIVVFEVDLFGRGEIKRPTDLFPRLTGVFYHPFHSINIMFAGFIAGLVLRNKFLISLSFISLIMTSSLRGPLAAILIILFFYFTKQNFKVFSVYLISLISVLIIILLVIYSAGDKEYSSNALRAYAWLSAIEGIQNSLYFGHVFEGRDLVGIDMNREVIESQGIAESYYLYTALHYGVPSMIFYYLFLSTLFIRSWNFCKGSEWTYLAVPFGVVFVDRFYGSLLTSYIILILLALIYQFIVTCKPRSN